MRRVVQCLNWRAVVKKKGWIIALAPLVFCQTLPVCAQIAVLQQDDPSTPSFSRQLMELQLDPLRLRKLEKAINARDYKPAEKILVEEAERDPRSPRSAKLLAIAGGIFFLDAQYLEAAIAWKKAEAIAPLDDRSRFTLAMAYVKLDRRDGARAELEKLAAAQPQNSLFLYWLGGLGFDARNYSSAVTRLQKVIELDPKMVRAYDTLGLCFDYLGKFNEAGKNYKPAVELNRLQSKPSPWPHVDLAISFIALNRLPEAEKNLREAVGYDPRLPQAHYQLGRVLEMQGDYQAAVESLKQAVALDTAYPEPHYLLGKLYHRLGSEPLSKAEIYRFLALREASEAQLALESPQPQM